MTDPDFDSPRARWLRGVCPCCGDELVGYSRDLLSDGAVEVIPTATIAEGVQVCGECVAQGHYTAEGDEFTPLLLAALLPPAP